jgi:hypothetical protein
MDAAYGYIGTELNRGVAPCVYLGCWVIVGNPEPVHLSE